MIFVTAGDKKYRPLVDACADSVEALGYQCEVFDLGGLGRGIPYDTPDVPDSHREYRRNKPKYMSETLDKYPGERVAWLDADSLLLRTVPEMETDDYDLAMKIKRKDGKFKLKSSIFFLNNTTASRRLLNMWLNWIPKRGRGDQRYLRLYIKSLYGLDESVADRGTIDLDGSLMKFLGPEYSHEVYLEEELDTLPKNAVSVHFSGVPGSNKFGHKLRYLKYWKEHHE